MSKFYVKNTSGSNVQIYPDTLSENVFIAIDSTTTVADELSDINSSLNEINYSEIFLYAFENGTDYGSAEEGNNTDENEEIENNE